MRLAEKGFSDEYYHCLKMQLLVVSTGCSCIGGALPAAAAAPAKTPKAPGGPPPPPPPPPPAGAMNKERDGNAQKPSGPGFSAVLSAINNKVSLNQDLSSYASPAGWPDLLSLQAGQACYRYVRSH